MSIDEIGDRLSVSRSTVYSWVRDLPRGAGQSQRGRAAGQAMREKHRQLRHAAYRAGEEGFDNLAREPGFRDFICMYIGEGTKRDRNMVAICNSDPAVMRLANRWITRLSGRKVSYSVQYHVDQEPRALQRYWAVQFGIDSEQVTLQRKSNSANLRGRSWRSTHGVLMIRTCDTRLRAMMEAWMTGCDLNGQQERRDETTQWIWTAG